MADYIQEQAKNYKTLNKAASEHGVVIFGSSYLHSFPFYDLMQGRVLVKVEREIKTRTL